MLDYESFKKKVLKEFLLYMPEEYSDCELEIKRIPKVNHCLTGVIIKPKELKGDFCSPTFYMERMYDQYKECGSFEKVMTNQAIYLEESLKYIPEDAYNLDFATMKDNNGIPVRSVFDPTDLPDYFYCPAHSCPMCRNGEKLNALVNSYGCSAL